MKLQSAPSSQGGRGAPCRAGTRLALWGWCPPGAAAQAQEQGNSNLSACCPHHPGFLRQLCVRSPGTGGARASSHHRLCFLFCFVFFSAKRLTTGFPQPRCPDANPWGTWPTPTSAGAESGSPSCGDSAGRCKFRRVTSKGVLLC